MEKIISHIIPDSIHTFTIEQEVPPARIDSILAEQFPKYSRSFFQKLIKNEHITCNDKTIRKPSMPIEAGDVISVHFPPAPTMREPRPLPAGITVEVIYEHPDFLIINKPANLVVHDPSHYHTEPTLVDWLIKHFKEISNVGSYDRPGIVHRLDKDTSGIMIIPRNNHAHETFGNMFRDRTIQKEYLAVAKGHPDREGIVDLPIDRDPNKRNQMTHREPNGRPSTTHYKVAEYYLDNTLVEVKPVTGRTHQIRVHLAAIGHRIIGDKIYGIPSKNIKRHALHAHAISFTYQNTPFHFSCNLPEDMKKLIDIQKKIDN